MISRQIALPVIVGAAALKGARLARRGICRPGSGAAWPPGPAAAFASTLVSLRLIAMLERSRSLLPYAAYRTALAARRCARCDGVRARRRERQPAVDRSHGAASRRAG